MPDVVPLGGARGRYASAHGRAEAECPSCTPACQGAGGTEPGLGTVDAVVDSQERSGSECCAHACCGEAPSQRGAL